jgi:hypothetical protein
MVAILKTRLPHLSPACPLTLGASTAPHGVLGSDNGMTGQSTRYGQYMPPWTLYIGSAPVSPLSALPPSAFGNSQLQVSTPCFPVSPPLSACSLYMPGGRSSPPLVRATASHASLS